MAVDALDTQVLIVGGASVGLSLAAELGQEHERLGGSLGDLLCRFQADFGGRKWKDKMPVSRNHRGLFRSK